MELGMIGLGRMGAYMTKRLLAAGHTVVAFDQDRAAVARSRPMAPLARFARSSGCATFSPCAVWVMVPAGDPVESTMERLKTLLKADDILIDGGNSNYRDTIERAAHVQKSGVHFVDVGTSGGDLGPERRLLSHDRRRCRRCETPSATV